MGTKIDIKSMNLSELEEYITSLGQPNYRAKQIFRWMHQGAVSFEEMSNLPEPLRRRLAEDCKITVPQVEKKQISILDGTIKYLWKPFCCGIGMGTQFAYPPRSAAKWAVHSALPRLGD